MLFRSSDPASGLQKVAATFLFSACGLRSFLTPRYAPSLGATPRRSLSPAICAVSFGFYRPHVHRDLSGRVGGVQILKYRQMPQVGLGGLSFPVLLMQEVHMQVDRAYVALLQSLLLLPQWTID